MKFEMKEFCNRTNVLAGGHEGEEEEKEEDVMRDGLGSIRVTDKSSTRSSTLERSEVSSSGSSDAALV